MNAPVLFDFTNRTVTPPGPLTFHAQPVARASDPGTSHKAAMRAKPGNSVLVAEIRRVVGEWNQGDPMDAFHIARVVESQYPRRWSEGTIRTAVSRAGLRAVDTEGRSPRGQRCIRYSL